MQILPDAMGGNKSSPSASESEGGDSKRDGETKDPTDASEKKKTNVDEKDTGEAKEKDPTDASAPSAGNSDAAKKDISEAARQETCIRLMSDPYGNYLMQHVITSCKSVGVGADG